MSNLANLRNLNFLKGADRVRYGIDYLRLNFDKPIRFFSDKMSWLVSNSDTIVEDWRTYSKIPLPFGICCMVSYSYNGISIPIMLYNTFWGNSIIQKYARLDFYGSFFRLINVWEFPEDYFTSFVKNITDETPTISRIDYCYDLFYENEKELPNPKKILKEVNNSTKVCIYKKGLDQNESWSCWSKTNKRYLIRYYNKLLDTQKKWKYFLYGDYLHWKWVHRFEIEFWPKFTRGYTLESIWSLLLKIQYFMGISDDFFNGTMFYKYESKFELNEYNKTRFFKQFVSKAKKIFYAKLNPYEVVFNWIEGDPLTNYERDLNRSLIKHVLKDPKFL